jgi:hypothetical protein
MRTPRYRYTEWRDNENINIAQQTEFSELSKKLKAQFDEDWQSAQPEEPPMR